MKLLISNGTLVNPAGESGKADVYIEEGIVKKIGAGLASNPDIKFDKKIDAAGLIVAPGFVDIHCHLREPGYEYKETIESGARAAAKGGFTTVCCMANTNPVADNAAVIAYIREKAKNAAVRVCPIGAVTKGLSGVELAEMGDMKKAGAVAFSDDGKSIMNGNIMRLGMEYASDFGCVVIAHCEDLTLVNEGMMNEGFVSTSLGLRGNTRAAEMAMIARDVIIAETFGLRVHIAHVSCRGSVEIIRQAKARGVKVTAETAPHYIAATDEAVYGFDTMAKVSPPLRTEEDMLALREALADGTIDCIATDHAPHHEDEKNVEFAVAASGISGFESAFSLCYTNLVKTGVLSVDKLIGLMSYAPAKTLSLDAGVIAEGGSSDITIIDPEAKYTINREDWVSKGKNSPFFGKEVYGRVVHTIAGGRVILENGKLNV